LPVIVTLVRQLAADDITESSAELLGIWNCGLCHHFGCRV